MNYRIKKTIACKEVGNYMIDASIIHTHTPQFGEVAVFEVLEIGKHYTVQGQSKRLVQIVEGDYILAAFANRYATEQFEGYVPDKPTEFLHILGAGGAMGIIKSTHAFLKDIGPTTVRLVGYAKDDQGDIINTVYYKTKRNTFTGTVPNNAKVILSVGSSMDSGKTTSAAYLARGLKTSGKKVAFIKLTGTSYTKDKDLVYDCGADISIDFIEAGYPSTYMLSLKELLDLYQTLLNMLAPENPDYIVMEIADGLVQRETEFLLRDSSFMKTIHSVVFSASDSLATFWGISFLSDLGHKPVAVAGLFTASPLLVEEVEARTNIPVLTLEGLMSKNVVPLFEPEKISARVHV
jgi:hypothetical protein